MTESAREVLARLKCKRVLGVVWKDAELDALVNERWSTCLAAVDRDIAALSDAGFTIVPVEPTKRMLHDGALVLVNSQEHKGVPQMAIYPVYEIYAALLTASKENT